MHAVLQVRITASVRVGSPMATRLLNLLQDCGLHEAKAKPYQIMANTHQVQPPRAALHVVMSLWLAHGTAEL